MQQRTHRPLRRLRAAAMLAALALSFGLGAGSGAVLGFEPGDDGLLTAGNKILGDFGFAFAGFDGGTAGDFLITAVNVGARPGATYQVGLVNLPPSSDDGGGGGGLPGGGDGTVPSLGIEPCINQVATVDPATGKIRATVFAERTETIFEASVGVHEEGSVEDVPCIHLVAAEGLVVTFDRGRIFGLGTSPFARVRVIDGGQLLFEYNLNAMTGELQLLGGVVPGP